MVDILRPNYGQVWASEGEKVSPVEDKMKLGWVQEMMPFQWENYLQGRQDDAILYLLQKGIAEYSPSQEYVAQKSVVVYQGAVYIALETVTGVLPSVSSSWKRLSTISDASGVVSIAGGGTGASTALAARTNLGLGSAALLAADSVVQKDTSGNFTAGVITASLAGNAATADKLKTARTVQITGAVTSTATQFDGSSNLAIPVTAIDASALTQGSVPASALGNSVTQTSATGAAILPVGPTADRPISPAFGHFRGNTTSGILEYYNGAEWVTSTAQSLSYVLNRGNHTGPLNWEWAAYGGAANAINLTPAFTRSAYTVGEVFRFRASAANTGATTINVGGLGAKVALTVLGTALPAGYIRTGVDTVCVYDGTYFIVQREIETGNNANGNYTRFADGLQVCQKREIRDRVVVAGDGITPNYIFAAGFIGVIHANSAVVFYEGLGSTGEALYGLGYRYGAGLLQESWVNIGKRPSAEPPSGTIGTITAKSAAIDTSAIGRWY